MNNRVKWFLTGGLIILLVGLIGYGVREFLEYRTSIELGFHSPNHPQVTITSPWDGSQFSQGDSIVIQVSATSPQKIKSIELYINSEISGDHPSPPGGTDFFSTDFLWIPEQVGDYILVAKAVGYDQLTSYSLPVRVILSEAEFSQGNEELAEIVSETFAPTERSPFFFGEEDPPSPAKTWKGSPSDWIKSMTVDSPPDPPELIASSENCEAQLLIHDLSDDEEGFEVWRLLSNSPTWFKLDILASQSQAEWIAYQDPGAQGMTSYYVSAFNSQGVMFSNLAQVQLDPSECIPPLIGQPILTLEMEPVQFPVDQFYCYFSFDGEGWGRSPQIGFYPARGAEHEEPSISTEIVSMNLPGDVPSTDAIPPTAIYLDCWGWSGSVLKYLGAFSPTLKPDQEEKVEVGTQGLNAIFRLKYQDLLGRVNFRTMGDEDFDLGPQIGIFEDQIEEIPPLLPALPIEPSMPWISAFITDEPESCRDHIPPQWQDDNNMTFFCSPFEGFNLGPGGPNPQHYLNWDPNAIPRCPNGQGPQCKDYYYWLSLASDLGHEIGFDVYDSTGKVFLTKSITTPEKFNYTIPPKPCTDTREFWVQMWYHDTTMNQWSYGPPSNKVSMPCPVALGSSMFLDIRFNDIVFFDVADEEPQPQDLDVYGYLRASTGTRTEYLNLASWFDPGSSCPDDFSVSPQTGTTPGCPIPFWAGTYNVIDQSICRSKNHYSCTETGWDKNNNTIRIIMDEGDPLTLSVKILDDDLTFDELVCEGTTQFQDQSIIEWAQMENELFNISGSTSSSGSCQIWGTLNAVLP